MTSTERYEFMKEFVKSEIRKYIAEKVSEPEESFTDTKVGEINAYLKANAPEWELVQYSKYPRGIGYKFLHKEAAFYYYIGKEMNDESDLKDAYKYFISSLVYDEAQKQFKSKRPEREAKFLSFLKNMSHEELVEYAFNALYEDGDVWDDCDRDELWEQCEKEHPFGK